MLLINSQCSNASKMSLPPSKKIQKQNNNTLHPSHVIWLFHARSLRARSLPPFLSGATPTPKATHSQYSTPPSPSWSKSIHCSHDHKPNLRQDVPENISCFFFALTQRNLKMSWTRPLLLTCLVVLSIITRE